MQLNNHTQKNVEHILIIKIKLDRCQIRERLPYTTDRSGANLHHLTNGLDLITQADKGKATCWKILWFGP